MSDADDAIAFFHAQHTGIEVDAAPPPRSPWGWMVAALVLTAVVMWLGERLWR